MGLGLWSLSVTPIFKTIYINKNDKPAATAVIKAQHAEPAVCKHGCSYKYFKSWFLRSTLNRLSKIML